MNWDQIENNWTQLKGNVQQQWSNLTDDHLDVIAGKRERLSGKIQEVYGVNEDEANTQLSDWQTMLTNLAKSDEKITRENFRTASLNHKDNDEKV